QAQVCGAVGRLDANGEGFRGNQHRGSLPGGTNISRLGARLWAPMRQVSRRLRAGHLRSAQRTLRLVVRTRNGTTARCGAPDVVLQRLRRAKLAVPPLVEPPKTGRTRED